MAPIDAAPAPVRKPWAQRVGPEPVEAGPADQDEDERRGERHERGQQPTGEPDGGVADDGDGLDDRPGGDLAEGHGVEELPGGHPVVGVDGVVLHHRDDHEPTAVGEQPDLEGHPGQRGEPAGGQGRDAPPAAAPADATGRPESRPPGDRTRRLEHARRPPAPGPATGRRWPPPPRRAPGRRPSGTGPDGRGRPGASCPGSSPIEAWSATAGTAAPAPAAAPRTHSGACGAKNSTDSARITTRPGTMKHSPPTSAPAGPRRRQAHRMASWVEAGPGQQVGGGDPVLELLGDSQPRRSTHSARSSAMWAGGPPKPMQPIRPHSRAMVPRPTWCGRRVPRSWSGPVTGPGRWPRRLMRRVRSARRSTPGRRGCARAARRRRVPCRRRCSGCPHRRRRRGGWRGRRAWRPRPRR